MDIGALVILGITVVSAIIKAVDENKKKNSRPQVVAEPIFEEEEPAQETPAPAFAEPASAKEDPAAVNHAHPVHVRQAAHTAPKTHIPKAAPAAAVEPERTREKLDARKMIIYSTIMEPKFEEKSF